MRFGRAIRPHVARPSELLCRIAVHEVDQNAFFSFSDFCCPPYFRHGGVLVVGKIIFRRADIPPDLDKEKQRSVEKRNYM